MSLSPPPPDGAHVTARAPTRVYCGGREPLFVAALAFNAGIIAGNIAWRGPHVWLMAFVVAAAGVGILYRRAPSFAFSLALLAVVPLGAFYLQLYDAAQATPRNLEAFATGEGTVDITAHVIREGIVRDSPYGGKQESADVEAEQLVTGEHRMDAPVGIRLNIFSKRQDEEGALIAGNESPLPAYAYGQRLHITAKLRAPRNYGNPGALDLVGYLASQGIRLTGSARATDVEVLPGFTGSRIGLWRGTARRSVLNHIQQLWPGEPGALMQAMLIGRRAFFARELKTNFQRTGTYHILVVSGINVGILAFAFIWALRWLPMGETTATVLTILLSWSYAFLADLGPPIVRATITLSIYLLTRLLFRDRAGLNALGIAALGILIAAPRTLFEASFQLTFLSVIAVAGIAMPVLQRTLYPWQRALRNLDSAAYDFSLPTVAAQFRSDVRLIREFLAQIVGFRSANFVLRRGLAFALAAGELVFISFVIELSLALPMAWYFHRTTTMSLPANVLVIPLASILMPAAVLAVALSYLPFWLAYVPAQVAGHSLAVLTGTIRLIGHLRISDLRLPMPAVVTCIFDAFTVGSALILARRRLSLAWLGIAGLLAGALAIVFVPAKVQWHPGVLEITAIDVGQGDSLLIVTPEGNALLLDSGGIGGGTRSDFDVGEEVVSPYLWSRGIRHLDVVAMSHPHSDHIGGMRAIIANFRPKELWYGLDSPTPEFAEVAEAAKSFDVTLKPHIAGDKFEFGGVQFRVLNPQPGEIATNKTQDDESMVLRLQYGRTAALLVGDSHKRIEELLIQEMPQADLLKIGHPGSLTSSSPEFLAAVAPQFAVVSAGYYNSFHHPRPEVMQRFAERHVQTYRTDLAGAVSFYLDGATVSAQPVPH
ncbi:MAG TPA: ComEC/Rec2 family competence protein [Candidatus Angelobacter sp.]|nr:ComEC/Rec2 family competence protein [Candidatus Angelobacter sp.]